MNVVEQNVSSATATASGPKRLLDVTSYTLFGIGLLSRLLPLFDQGGRVLRQFPTEDGYLMLTIARNLALGRGMSTAEGLIPTNGTQPLFNLVEASCFWLVGGERWLGVLLVQLVSVVISVGAAWLLARIARDAIDVTRPLRDSLARFAAALWFSSSVIVPHSMNCLETGLYLALGIASVLVWYRFTRDEPSARSWPRCLGLGGLLGLTFLARIDAVFLILALTSWHLLGAYGSEAQQWLRRLKESTLMGLTSVVVGSPWLIYNQLNFGSIMPISGTAQSHAATFGSNWRTVPFKVFEYGNLVVPIPQSVENTLPGLVVGVVLMLAYLALVVVVSRRLTASERLLFRPMATLAVLLLGYYGLYFGAEHFVGRYTSPISPWTAVLAAGLVGWLCERAWRSTLGRFGALGVAAVTVLVTLGLNARWYAKGDTHMHFQVVRWVEEHTSEAQWVGAVQTGTLGFFHERTINLDGKVNPDALTAVLERRIPTYIVEEHFGPEHGQIQYVVDWNGVAGWAKLKPLDCHFELLVSDAKQNLAVLGRREQPLQDDNCQAP